MSQYIVTLTKIRLVDIDMINVNVTYIYLSYEQLGLGILL